MAVCLKTITACPGVWSIPEYQEDFNPPTRQTADPAQFGNWHKNQPWSTQRIFTPCKRDSRWGKISRTFYKEIFFDKEGERVKNEDPQGSKQLVKAGKQKYVICLDPNSPFAGNVYRNDSKGIIYVKFLASLLVRPGHIVLKTLYHATLIDVAVIIFEGIRKEKPAKEILQSVVCSLSDIVRTPVYGVAIMIVTLGGILLAPFHPELVYDIRAVIARLSRELGWGKKGGFHDFTPCMQPLVNVMEFTLNYQQIWAIRTYEDSSNPVLVALDNRRSG